MIEQMSKNATQAAAFLKGLSSQHRLVILCQLSEGEKCVSDLINSTGLAQTSMSQHLKKLQDEGIITHRREHRTLFYSIDNVEALEIMQILYKKFCAKDET